MAPDHGSRLRISGPQMSPRHSRHVGSLTGISSFQDLLMSNYVSCPGVIRSPASAAAGLQGMRENLSSTTSHVLLSLIELKRAVLQHQSVKNEL